MQWFLVGDSQKLLTDQTCQSVILDATWIAKQAEGKWLGCRYILNGIQYKKNAVFPVWRPGNTAEPGCGRDGEDDGESGCKVRSEIEKKWSKKTERMENQHLTL